MLALLLSTLSQAMVFLPMAVGISISYTILRATDMTLDGSFVLGAAVFAKLITLGVSPIISACLALVAGALAGVLVSLIQRGGRVDPLLAGILAMFILTSGNLILMGRPNINLLSQVTLLSQAFADSEMCGYALTAVYSLIFCSLAIVLVRTRFGLLLRALGDNPTLLARLGNPLERYRLVGFALTNMLAAASGMLTAQTVGYADIGMGLGMTLTGIGAIILGQQIVIRISVTKRVLFEMVSCLFGVVIYFFAINFLLRFEVNPVYLKMILGLILIFFLRTAHTGRVIA